MSKPYNQRTVLGKLWLRITGRKNDEKLSPAEVAVKLTDFIKRLVNNPALSAYVEASNANWDNQMLQAAQRLTLLISSRLGLISAKELPWQDAAQQTGNAIRALKDDIKPQAYMDYAANAYLLGANAQIDLSEAVIITQEEYYKKKKAGEIS